MDVEHPAPFVAADAQLSLSSSPRRRERVSSAYNRTYVRATLARPFTGEMLKERTDPEKSSPDVLIPPWVIQQAEVRGMRVLENNASRCYFFLFHTARR